MPELRRQAGCFGRTIRVERRCAAIVGCYRVASSEARRQCGRPRLHICNQAPSLVECGRSDAFITGPLANSCQAPLLGRLSNCSPELRRPTDVSAEVLIFGWSGRNVPQKKPSKLKRYPIRSVKRMSSRPPFQKTAAIELSPSTLGQLLGSHLAASIICRASV